ncbi:MAG: hypothetical protein ACI814_003628 [Mariniblastus sp.]|jgi:hypothetical protein
MIDTNFYPSHCSSRQLPFVDWIRTGASQFSMARHGFMSCIVFILSVSIYDCYLVALYRDHVLHGERNPICEILIRNDPNGLTWFMLGKCLGNLGVVSILITLRWLRYRPILIIAASVAMFQMILLVYLTYSDPLTGFLHFDDIFSNDPLLAGIAIKTLAVHLACLAITVTLAGFKWKTIRNTAQILLVVD